MTPYWTSGCGRWTVYHGDCLAVLPTLAAGSVDAVVTDPPFEAEAHTMQRRKLGLAVSDGREIVSAPLDFAPIGDAQRTGVALEIARVANGWALVFCQAEAVAAWRDAMQNAGAAYRRAMVWVKPDGMPQYSGDRPGMGYESIVASWCGDGRSRWNGGGKVGVFTHNKNTGGGPHSHPTQKPAPLMVELLRLFTDPDTLILDPFLGSGTTLVACVKTGRRGIGIEIDERYCEIAVRRIEAEANHLFAGVAP